MNICYEVTDDDHIPLNITIDVENAPELTSDTNDVSARLHWQNLTEEDKEKYCLLTDNLLKDVQINDCITCNDLNCKNKDHAKGIDDMYQSIIGVLKTAGVEVFGSKQTKRYINKPGWADYVADLYDASRQSRSVWLNAGRPRQGPLHDLHLKTKARFKYALRFIKRNEETLRKESLAKKMSNLNHNEFWKEIKVMNNCNTPLPTNIDGATGYDEIAKLWKNHFYQLFNCIKDSDVSVNLNISTPYESVCVSGDEIEKAVKDLACNKSCGLDGIYSEHLKFASSYLVDLLSYCFSSMFVHGVLPESMLSVVLVPVLKDKAGKITSKDNYRPIALASVVSKIVEIILYNRIIMYIDTRPNQFGFKKKHGTDMGIYVLKEFIDYYRAFSGSVFVCCLDASKAFDRVNHKILFGKLIRRGVPGYIVRLLMFWYGKQLMCVRWGNKYSEFFNVSNGVRQGGILSPQLFNVYVDDLSNRLNVCRVGYFMNDIYVNNIMYADDLVILAPSTAGLNKLLRICELFAKEHDMLFNAKKSAILKLLHKNLQNATLPSFKLNGDVISEVESTKYLGQFITNDLSDNLDIERQCKKLYIQGNIIMRKFYMCSLDVKITLFRAYCMPMYCAHLWWCYTKSKINKLYVAYHNVFKMFLGVSKFESTSLMCTVCDVKNCSSLIRNLIYKFMLRLQKSENVIIRGLLESSIYFVSRIRRQWFSLLYVYIKNVNFHPLTM